MFANTALKSVCVKYGCIVVYVTRADLDHSVPCERLPRSGFIMCQDVKVPHASSMRLVSVEFSSNIDVACDLIDLEVATDRELSGQPIPDIGLSVYIGILRPHLEQQADELNVSSLPSQNYSSWNFLPILNDRHFNFYLKTQFLHLHDCRFLTYSPKLIKTTLKSTWHKLCPIIRMVRQAISDSYTLTRTPKTLTTGSSSPRVLNSDRATTDRGWVTGNTSR